MKGTHIKCPECEGKGTITIDDCGVSDNTDVYEREETCSECGGKGVVSK